MTARQHRPGKGVFFVGTLVALAAGSALLAQSAGGPFAAQITARQSHMRLYAFNIGPLVAMAKGEMPYDAKIASASASNLAALASLDQSRYWPEGSDSFENEGTNALPKIWDNIPDVIAKAQDLAKATSALAQTAGDGLDALRAGISPVGGACGACHKAYRKPKDG